MNDVSLTISKDLVAPIVEAKIKEAILAALGGGEEVIAKVLDQIMLKKVNENGVVSSYSSDNKYNWIDIVLTKQVKEIAEVAIKEEIAKSAEQIKNSLAAKLKSKQGSDMVAKALLDGLNGTFKNSWSSKMSFDFSPNK